MNVLQGIQTHAELKRVLHCAGLREHCRTASTLSIHFLGQPEMPRMFPECFPVVSLAWFWNYCSSSMFLRAHGFCCIVTSACICLSKSSLSSCLRRNIMNYQLVPPLLMAFISWQSLVQVLRVREDKLNLVVFHFNARPKVLVTSQPMD